MIDLFIFAGELSGDKYGALLINEIRQGHPLIKISAVAGPKMRSLNIHTLLEMEEFEVIGLIDIIKSLPKLIKNFFKVRNYILKTNPKTVIFIDYPGFNLKMEKSLRKKKFKGKIIHYISPSVWAWHKSRIKTLNENVDLLLTIFPFEKEHFKEVPLKVEYVGHPLLTILKNHNYAPFLKKSKKLIGIFPGSRKEEIERNLPMQLQAAIELQKEDPDIDFLISIAHPKFKDIIEDKRCIPKLTEKSTCGLVRKLSQYEDRKDVDINATSTSLRSSNSEVLAPPTCRFFNQLGYIPSDKNYDVMPHLDLAIATSGTITLELALHQVPTVVTYAIKPLDLFIVRRILRVNLPFYCIVNIIMAKEIFPELFGSNLTKENLLKYSREFLYHPTHTCKENCSRLKGVLQTAGNKNTCF